MCDHFGEWGEKNVLTNVLYVLKEQLDPHEAKSQQMAQRLFDMWFDERCFVYAHASVS